MFAGKRIVMVCALAGFGVVLGVGSAWAHRAFSAEFDARKPVKFTGTPQSRMDQSPLLVGGLTHV
jgi:hypothetical protein